jgi:bacterial/archaeal transporter family protein
MEWLVFALLSALFAGLVAIFGKIGVRDVDSTLATMVRSIIMALTLISIVLFKTFNKSESVNLDNLKTISARTWAFIALAGISGAISWLFYFRALQLGDASKIAPVDRLSVLFVIIFGVLFLGEKLTWGVGLGGLLVLAGSIIIVRG